MNIRMTKKIMIPKILRRHRHRYPWNAVVRRLALDGDALGLGDLLSQLLRRGQQRSAIISLAQDRPDAAQNAAGVSHP